VQDTSYLLYPRINTTVCDTVGGEVGPTLGALLHQAVREGGGGLGTCQGGRVVMAGSVKEGSGGTMSGSSSLRC
jgi:hypothetical protein